MSDILLYGFKVTQPIGSYYMSKMKICDLRDIKRVDRKHNSDGVQRALHDQKVKSIEGFCDDPDAVFPTPIIISIKHDFLKCENLSICDDLFKIEIKRISSIASIIDGQHRVEGILMNNENSQLEIPVVIMIDLQAEDEAYVFATINANQKKVDKSLIYQLYDVYENRSPRKTCHEVAKALNINPESPFYKRLRITDVKSNETESLTQGSFAYYLLPLICSENEADEVARQIKRGQKPSLSKPLSKFFMLDKDEYIVQTLKNYFNAIRNKYPSEWENTKNIICKSTGYGGFMRALEKIVPFALERQDLSVSFFEKGINKFKENQSLNNKSFDSTSYPSSSAGQNLLRDEVIHAFEEVYGVKLK